MMRLRSAFVASFFLLSIGCEEDAPPAFGDAPADGAAPAPRGRKPAAEEKKEEGDLPPPVDFQETAFVESERSRDPFRSFARMFVDEARGEVTSQREVVLEQYSLDELVLVALVKDRPSKAMLVDPTGLGHVVQRGQYVGRASVVKGASGQGAEYEVNWRIDRIRDGDMVLVRDDPSNPEVPSATRVLPLRTDDLTPTGGKKNEEASSGLENELRKMQERLAQMAQTQAAKKRESSGSN